MRKLIKITLALMLPLACISMLTLIILNPVIAKQSAIKACEICALSVIPTLLPFFILSHIIINTRISDLLGLFFKKTTRLIFNLPSCTTVPILIGFLAGFPTGAKMALELYNNKQISRDEASRLIAITNNASPLFIIGIVGNALSSKPIYGYYLFIIQTISIIFTGFIYGQYSKITNPIKKKNIAYESNNTRELLKNITQNITTNWNNIIINAFKESTQTILQVCSFIIFFGLVSSLLRQSLIYFVPVSFALIFTALIEMTTGVLSIIGFMPISRPLLIIVSIIISLGGLSVYMQISSITKTQISLKEYLRQKVFQAILCALLINLSFGFFGN